MAGQRSLPGLGIRGFWTPGSNDFEQQLDPDLRKLSVLVQASVISRTTNLPGSPSDGDIYIIPEGQTNENQIAARDDGAWVNYVPAEGFLVYVKDDDEYVKWTGSAWEVFSGGSMTLVSDTTTARTISDADLAGGVLLRMSNSAATTITVESGLVGKEPVTVVQEGAGTVSFAFGVGVTLNSLGAARDIAGQYGSATLIPAGTDNYILVGALA